MIDFNSHLLAFSKLFQLSLLICDVDQQTGRMIVFLKLESGRMLKIKNCQLKGLFRVTYLILNDLCCCVLIIILFYRTPIYSLKIIDG